MRKIAALSIASVFASGCGTTASQLGYWDGEPDPRLPYIWGGTTLPYIYGGTTFDVAVVVDAAKADGPGGIAALLVFDLPFSLVADTVLLPLTIYQQIDRAFWTEEQFIQSLSHPDSAVRAHAATQLGRLDGTTSEGIVALRGALADPAREVRFEAIVALRELGPKSLPAVPDLILLIRDDDARIRAEVARTLAAIGSDSDSVVSALITLLKDDNFSLRWAAALSLGELGPVARSAETALRAALNDEMAVVRDAAAEALTRIRNGTRPDLTE